VQTNEDHISWWSTIFVTFIDDFLKKTHVYLFKRTGKLFNKFKAVGLDGESNWHEDQNLVI
jgi:hypothetical protein